MSTEAQPTILINKKIIVTAFLFLIGTLHMLVYSFVQFPGTFISEDINEDPITFKLILYSVTIVVSCYHQHIAKRIGLKNVLILGLLANAAGLLLLYFHHFVEHPNYHLALYLSMVCFGAALLSVINSLVTYIILEFPSKTVTAITALFIFLNGGIMLAPVVLNTMLNWGLNWSIFFFIVTILILVVVGIRFLFVEPIYPKDLDHLRSGTLLWKEMHKRLALYVLAVFFYSLIESTFSLWGTVLLAEHAPLTVAEDAASIFWLFMIIGQIVLLIPLYYFEARRVFYFLIPAILFALIYTPLQTHVLTISVGFAIGGAACAPVYPIILALLEMEIIRISLMSNHANYLPLVETAVSFLNAGYVLGPAVVDIWIYMLPTQSASPYFNLAIGFIAAITILMIYLNKTRIPSVGIKGTFLQRH
jgi:MFS family permease